MTRNVQDGPSVTMAHHLSALAAANSIMPAVSGRVEGMPQTKPSAIMARNAAGYAIRIILYTSSGGSTPPRARCVRSFEAASVASTAIEKKTTIKMASAVNILYFCGGAPPPPPVAARSIARGGA